jgi:hypothetical protein
MSESGERALGGARHQRMRLKQALSEVEIAAAGASADPTWRDDLGAALSDLLDAFDAHVDEVEGGDGLLADVVTRAPRLAKRVDRLGAEHPPLRAQIVAARAKVATGDVDEVRSEILDALVALAKHRQTGADLVYDAYNVDIGGE